MKQSHHTQNHLENALASLNHDHSPSHEPSRSGERTLWCSVIIQALMDASSNSHKVKAKREKRNAKAWLFSGSKDFYTVCAYADLDPSKVAEFTKDFLRKNHNWKKIIKQAKQEAASQQNTSHTPFPIIEKAHNL